MKTIDVVFTGPPSQPAPQFVEVEDGNGVSIRAGWWLKRTDGFWALRIEPRVNRAAVAIASGVSFLVGFVASSLTTMVMMLPTDVLWGLILSWCL